MLHQYIKKQTVEVKGTNFYLYLHQKKGIAEFLAATIKVRSSVSEVFKLWTQLCCDIFPKGEHYYKRHHFGKYEQEYISNDVLRHSIRKQK